MKIRLAGRARQAYRSLPALQEAAMTLQLWPSSIRARLESPGARPDVVARRSPDSVGEQLERTYWDTLRDVLALTQTAPRRRPRSHKGRAA